jgi:hypothetical protein
MGGDAPSTGDAASDVTRESPPEDNDVGRSPERVERDATPKAGRSSTSPGASAPARTPTRGTPAPAASAPELRVATDVPGAMVFLNRKYLGTTPLVSRDITPGSHQLNVQVEGVEPSVQTVEIAEAGPTSVTVALKQTRLDTRVPVVHKHGTGSCEGTLIATSAGLRYQTSHANDAFTLPFAQVETFAIDYMNKNLRVKQRGGRTWNFSTRDDNADPLLVFHREVEQGRP